MPPPPNLSGLRDNYTRGTVADFLRAKSQPGSRVSIVSAYFTIYAYDALKAEFDRIEHLDFLFGEPSFVNRLDPSRTEPKSFLIDAEGLQLAHRLQQKRVARDCAEWIERQVDIRTIRQSSLLHGKMYHLATAGVEDAILGSSNFTVHGLGLGAAGNNLELNLIVDSNRDRQELKQWFAEVWNNDALVKDVKADVLLYLRKLYANQSPQFIYYLTLFHLFRDYLDGTRDLDDNLRRRRTCSSGPGPAPCSACGTARRLASHLLHPGGPPMRQNSILLPLTTWSMFTTTAPSATASRSPRKPCSCCVTWPLANPLPSRNYATCSTSAPGTAPT